MWAKGKFAIVVFIIALGKKKKKEGGGRISHRYSDERKKGKDQSEAPSADLLDRRLGSAKIAERRRGEKKKKKRKGGSAKPTQCDGKKKSSQEGETAIGSNENKFK